MKIGIGIDTGGTCTDAVIYNFEEKKILAYAKSPTTKEDLSVGISHSLEKLPRDLLNRAEVIALSTTLATNACVEGKGGRAKLAFFSVNRGTVFETGREYGLPLDESLVFVDSKTRINGLIETPPDWTAFKEKTLPKFADCDAAGVVELFAQKTGAELEKKAAGLIGDAYGIPIVCGHELFTELNIVKRGASTLLNARLISIIKEFTAAVKRSMKKLEINIPFVIVRSDGSLMTEKFAQLRPIETLLCGPVASVMGAVELTSEPNCVVVDIGGTTTDISFVKNGVPKRTEDGVKIGSWSTFVKGLFVDTFGLGGDSGVILTENGSVGLAAEKVMPLCMAAEKYPHLLKILHRIDDRRVRAESFKNEIYLGIKDISDSDNYKPDEKAIAEKLYHSPLSIEELGKELGAAVLQSQLQRLISEGVIIRCGLTPTDVMHVKGDFTEYNIEAAVLGVRILARIVRVTPDEMGDLVYDAFKRKLYCNIVRILIEDADPEIRKTGPGPQLERLINNAYDQAKSGKPVSFMGIGFRTPAVLVGVGAPTHIFLGDVGKLLQTKVVSSEYSKVANALGAIVGNICAKVTMEVAFDPEDASYIVYGAGERLCIEELDEAKETARAIAEEKARKEANERGANPEIDVEFTEEENIIDTNFGTLYLGYRVTATAAGELNLESLAASLD